MFIYDTARGLRENTDLARGLAADIMAHEATMQQAHENLPDEHDAAT